MADVPEHLLKRSQERRKALGLPVEGGDAGEAAPEAPASHEPAPAHSWATPTPAAPAPVSSWEHSSGHHNSGGDDGN